MIIQTGMRTDIPAYYAEWFANRLREGYVLVRNPYNYIAVTRYEINPEVVDLIGFCSKNPEPMLKHIDLLKPYGQYWFVTITPYGTDIEPHVPPADRVMDTFRRLSETVGRTRIAWRYDPILVTEEWTAEKHIGAFEKMAEKLSGYTDICVISFIDLYDKVRRNFPEVREVPHDTQVGIAEELVRIGRKYGIMIRPCGRSRMLSIPGADNRGCMTVEIFEKALGMNLRVPPNPNNRKECACYLTGDIGQYNTCGHLCRYCYANAEPEIIRENMRRHDPRSPMLIGSLQPTDEVHEAKQVSWKDPQIRLDLGI